MCSQPDNRGSVLVVEDQPLVADLFEDMLVELGYHLAGTSPTAAGAIALLGYQHVDVAILDIELGDGASFAVADLCSFKGIPVLYTTGYNARDVPANCGDKPVLPKPFSLMDLQRSLDRATAAS